MIQEESGLFQVRFTEEGKKYIRKFAAISYVMLGLVIAASTLSIYWNIKAIRAFAKVPAAYRSGWHIEAMPYFLIFLFLLALVGNMYYVRFPNVLIRCIDNNDEPGANRAFRVLYKGAYLFLVWLVLNTASLVWSLLERNY